MFLNVKPSKMYPRAGLNSATGSIPPQSLAAAATATGGWVQVPASSKWLHATLMSGALGGGSEQLDLEQAKDGSGTGAKALLTSAIAAQTTNNRSDEIDVNLDAALDVNGGFFFVRQKITNTGGTGALVAGSLTFGPNSYAD